jgi:hypothetical protein
MTTVFAADLAPGITKPTLSRAFCAGLDLKQYDRLSSEEPPQVAGIRQRQRQYAGLAEQLRALPQPVVAAVNGPAAGRGLALLPRDHEGAHRPRPHWPPVRIVRSPDGRSRCRIGSMIRAERPCHRQPTDLRRNRAGIVSPQPG